LSLWDLVFIGIILVQPTAPMSVYGVIHNKAAGHATTTILIAMVAMLFTAISYGRMARAYPSAGSAFTYVGQEINPALGYVTGWSMAMDYMLNPIICVIWVSQQAHEFAPGVPLAGWKMFFAVVFTALNILGIRTSARINSALAVGMGVVIAVFFVAAARFILHDPHDAAFYARPFYDPQMWNTRAVLGGTSVAVLTYIGFDGISTLSEEAENPRRNVLLATVLTCLVIGILSAFEVYAAQLVWPAAEPFPNLDTAFVHVAGRAWHALFPVVGFTLLVANFGSGMGSHLGAARLLYGMGRSNALPRSFFGVLDPVRRVPKNNVLFVGGIALIGSFALAIGGGDAYGFGVEMLNFGALIAFMGVNAAAFLRYYVRAPVHGEERRLTNLVPPILGFAICLLLWLNLTSAAKIAGAVWMISGIAFGAWKTRGFRSNLVTFEVPPEDEPSQTKT
jgi:amino acid transporter